MYTYVYVYTCVHICVCINTHTHYRGQIQHTGDSKTLKYWHLLFIANHTGEAFLSALLPNLRAPWKHLLGFPGKIIKPYEVVKT